MVLQPLPLSVRWSSTARAVAASRDVVLDDQEGVDWERLPLRGDVHEVVAAFHRLPHRQLVILGEAGAGKSVLAMLLTIGLIDRSGPESPVPVLLPIASWNPLAESIEGFVIRRLREGYRFLDHSGQDGRSYAEVLLGTGRILLVLDGLDELAPRSQAGALQTLDRFAPGRRLVVTCRSREYERAVGESGAVLSRAAVVEIEPVDLAAVIDFLSHPAPSRRRWEPVFEDLRAHPDGPLGQALSTPLMVSLARANYRDPSTDPIELLGPSDPDGVTRLLLDAFIPTVYDPVRGGGNRGRRRYGPDQAARWLECVAFHLDRTGNRDFWWWQLGPGTLSVWPETAGVLTAMIAGWSAAVLVGATSIAFVGVARGAGVALVTLTIIGVGVLEILRPLWPGGYPAYVHLSYRTPRWRRVQRIRLCLLAGILPGAMAGALLNVPLPGLAAGLVTGLAMAVLQAALPLGGLSFIPRSRRSTPRGTVYATLDNALVAAVTLGLLGGAAFAVLAGIVTDLDTATAVATAFSIYALTAAFSAGLSDWGRFRITHLRLALQGWLPWRLWPFLADALDRGILRQAGTAWQFRHALLQDHLARSIVPRHLQAQVEAGYDYAVYQLVDLLIQEGREEEAFELLRHRANDPEPDEEDLWARHQLLDLLPRYGRVDEAIALLQDRAGRDGSAAEQLVDLLVEHHRVEALTSRADAGDSFAAKRLAALLARQGQESELRSRIDGGDVHAGARLADLLLEQHRSQEAVDFLRDHVPAWWAERRLADLLAENGNTDEAVAMLSASERAKAKRHLVRLLAAHGQVEEAMSTLLSIAENDPTWARHQLIDLLLQQGRTDEAITMLRDRADAGDRWWAARRLVKLLVQQGQIEELRTRAAKDPYAAQRLVDVLIQQGRVDEAIGFCRSHADARKHWARQRLTELLAQHGRTNELRALADAGDPHAAAWLVESLVDQGRIDQAVTVLRIRADAGDPWAAQQLSLIISSEDPSRV